MFAKNFQFLSKHYYKDKQNVLEGILGMSQGTISDYANGKKKAFNANINLLRNISYRYDVSIDDLINSDLEAEYGEQVTITSDSAVLLGENLPILTSEHAKSNDNFIRAYDIFQTSFQLDGANAIEKAIENLMHAVILFQKAWDEAKTYCALSNSIATILLMYTLCDPRVQGICRDLINHGNVSMRDIEYTGLRDPQKHETKKPYDMQQKAIFEKYNELVYDNIKHLKNNMHFAQLGDYYLALCYFVGFAEDFMEYKVCVQTGTYMLMQLLNIGNEYAAKLIESISQIS